MDELLELEPKDPLRIALLQRLANDFAAAQAVMAGDYSGEWQCCWLDYRRNGRAWTHRLCGQCYHLHHWHEATTALG